MVGEGFAPARHPRCVCSVADLLIERFGAAAVDAVRVEAKLPPNLRDLPRHRVFGVCDKVKSQLKLSEAELRKVVLAFSGGLGL